MFYPTIGLEIHIEAKTKTKMFCSCLNESEPKEPNINTCPVCTGQPGALPVINEKAVEAVLKFGLALNCSISPLSKFDRKNYFYPDLPKGYQISQYDLPFCQNGYLVIPQKDSSLSDVKIRITRIHLEEDAGKLIHPENQDYSLVDLNRAGVPLLELVTEPDIHSSQDAKKFCQELQLIAQYLGISDANMEKGEMRCEANVSINRSNLGVLGTKVEIKNLNSFSAVEKAIEYELKRQEEILSEGKKVAHETRGWDENKQITFSQRSKEEAHDYRYFPEPDLPSIKITEDKINEISAMIPELPNDRRLRFRDEYKLTPDQTEILVFNKQLGEYFENVVSEITNWEKIGHDKKPHKLDLIKLVANYVLSDFQGILEENKLSADKTKITAENFAELILMIHQNKISSKIAKEVLKKMFETGADPSNIVKEKGLEQVSDESQIIEIAKKIIETNPQAATDYKSGKENALQFLAGQILKETKGKANPKMAQEILKKLL